MEEQHTVTRNRRRINVGRILIALTLASAALSGCAIYPAYPAVVVGPPVVRVYPAPPPPVVYRPYYGYRRYW
jgi:hypothetical protein